MTATIFKFPYDASRRAFARLPRVSKNGTPEERAAVQEPAAEGLDALPLPRPSLSATGQNERLRVKRRDAWRAAEAVTRYWKLRMEFQDAVSIAQRHDTPEGRLHPAVESDRPRLVGLWREAIVRQLLTPAPDTASIKWKQTQLSQGQYSYTGLKPERIERAIADDTAFLAEHPVRQSKRRSAKG